MDQDTRWLKRYNEGMGFMEKNHRNPSKHFPEERNMHSWCHHCRKQINQGVLKPEQVEMFKKLQELAEKYKRKNQYE